MRRGVSALRQMRSRADPSRVRLSALPGTARSSSHRDRLVQTDTDETREAQAVADHKVRLGVGKVIQPLKNQSIKHDDRIKTQASTETFGLGNNGFLE